MFTWDSKRERRPFTVGRTGDSYTLAHPCHLVPRPHTGGHWPLFLQCLTEHIRFLLAVVHPALVMGRKWFGLSCVIGRIVQDVGLALCVIHSVTPSMTLFEWRTRGFHQPSRFFHNVKPFANTSSNYLQSVLYAEPHVVPCRLPVSYHIVQQLILQIGTLKRCLDDNLRGVDLNHMRGTPDGLKGHTGESLYILLFYNRSTGWIRSKHCHAHIPRGRRQVMRMRPRNVLLNKPRKHNPVIRNK